MSTVIQRSFAGGELSPSLGSRVDTVKYQTSLKTLRNYFVLRHGGASNRPGTSFVGEVKDSTKTVKLIPFIFNADQTYMLEFGNLYIRIIQDGAYITETAKVITAATKANPIVVTSASHGFSNGDEVYISGVVGMTELNGRNFRIASVTSNTFSLTYLDSTNVDSTSFTTYSSAGTAERIYTVTSPYIERDLSELQYVQSADVVTIVHKNYAVRELSRTGNASWFLTQVTFSPVSVAPTAPSAVQSGTTGSTTYTYVITTIASDTFEESLVSAVATCSNGNATLSVTNFITVSWTLAANYSEYNVYKASNGIYGFIGVAGGTSFIDNGGLLADTTQTPPSARDPFGLSSSKTITGITQANPAVVTSAAHGYLEGDLIYIESVSGMTQVNNLFFFVGTVTTNTFALNSFDGTATNSTAYTAYSSGGTAKQANNYPSTATYFQQRAIYAATRNNPETVYTSRTGLFHNFTLSSPIQDDDAVTFSLAGRQVNEVKSLVELGKFVSFTSGGEWQIAGDAAGILRPTDINPKQHTYNGSGSRPPIIIGGNALYLQARGSVVRDLGFDYQIDGYRGNDLTIFANHLFDNYTITDWTYQQIPNSIVWAVRDDGTLLGLTYVKEHQIFGWHRHDFEGGIVENVSVIPEGNEDSLYVVVRRTIDGRTTRYVEKMVTRQIDDIVDSVFLDSSLSYDGRNTTATTMTLTGSGWTYNDTLTLTASASFFTAADIGNSIFLTGSDGTLIRASITAYTSATVVSVKPNKTVPAPMQAVAITTWTRAVDTVSGLWHLEGEDVSVFADGFVVANPNNDSYVVVTVTDGSITLDKPYGVIHVGLPYTSDLETLDIDTAQGETITDKQKIISRLNISVHNSRGIWAGSSAPDETVDFLDGLTELKIRNDESYDSPVSLATEVAQVNIRPEWNSNGRIFIRQTDPIPLTILAIAPSGIFPFPRGGS